MSKRDNNGLTINNRLELIRKMLGFKRKEFARILDCKLDLLINIEMDKQRPTSDVLTEFDENYPWLTHYLLTGKSKNLLTKEQKAFLRKLAEYPTETVKEILKGRTKLKY